MSLVRWSLFAVLLLFSPAATTTESITDRLEVHGFVSQAAVLTSDNRFFGDSDATSFDFTEIGINLLLPLSPRILLSGQVLARRAGEMYDGTPALDYALADVTLVSAAEQRWGLRIGRIKNPLGIYNETRDVPFTRPSILLPQVIYFDRVRNLVLSSDGLMLYGELYGDQGTLALTVGGGQSVVDENVEWAYLGNNFPGDFETDGPTGLFRLWYSTPDERLRLGFSGAALTLKLDSGLPDSVTPGTTDIFYWIASAQYDTEHWSLSAEYAREPLEWRDFGLFFPNRKATGEGYYLQGTYRIRPDMELLLRYEAGFADRKDRDGVRASALSGGLLPPFNGYSKIWTVGWRWDINRNWMVRADFQRHDGTFILSPRENPDPSQWREHWNLLAVQVGFRF